MLLTIARRTLVPVFVLTLLAACGGHPKPGAERTAAKKPADTALQTTARMAPRPEDSTFVLRQAYFDQQRLKPVAVVEQRFGGDSGFRIGSHRVEWHDGDAVTWLRIDGRRIRLKGKKTLNHTYGDEPDDVDFANSWTEARLYRYGGKEWLLLTMVYHPCTGMACSVQYFLLYDCATGTPNFFGSFRGRDEPWVITCRNRLAFVAEDYNEEYSRSGTRFRFTDRLYVRAANGRFSLARDAQGKPFELVTITHPDDSTVPTIYRQHWFEPVR